MTRPDSTHGGVSLDVHRLLDEALAGTEMTPERQDLKEEIRANLVARVTELRGLGVGASEAARLAVDDLGDLRGLVEDVDPDAGSSAATSARSVAPASPGGSPPAWAHPARRIRPRPDFVVRAVLQGAVALGGLVVLGFAAAGLDVPLAGRLAAVVMVALAAAVLTADALRQESSSSYPMPSGRAAGYGTALGLALAGIGIAWQYAAERAAGWLIAGAVLLLGAVVTFAYLAATQTNRHKAWVLGVAAQQAQVGDRFSEDPAAAARFGLYTLATWLAAVSAFVALTLTVGWAWSWTAIVAGVAINTIVLARMLFGPRRE